MKISLQIILADARSPGRGLPPPPFDRHVSGELPDLDNIIQERESQYGDSARAGTVQLPRAAPASSARRPVPTQRPGSAPSAPGLEFGVPPLGWGTGRGPAIKVPPLRVPPSAGDRPLAARFLSLGCVTRPSRPGPIGQLSSASGPDPTDAQSSLAVAGESPGLACPSKAACGPTREPTRELASPRLPICPRPGQGPPSLCRCSPGPLRPCGLLTGDLNEALGRGLVARGKPQSRRTEFHAALAGPWLRARRPARVGVGNLVSRQTRGLIAQKPRRGGARPGSSLSPPLQLLLGFFS